MNYTIKQINLIAIFITVVIVFILFLGQKNIAKPSLDIFFSQKKISSISNS